MKASYGYCKVPTILQMEVTECGAACLAMILAYYGRYIPLEQLRLETDVARDGISFQNIINAAELHNLEGTGHGRDKIETLAMSRLPAIIWWEQNHFVVFEGIRGKYAYINDPAYGRRKLSLSELANGYSGRVLEFSPCEGFIKVKKREQLLSSLLKRMQDYTGLLLKLFYIGLLLVFPGILLAVLSQVFMDDVLGKGFVDWLARLLAFFTLALSLKIGMTAYRSLLLQKMECYIQKESVERFIRHLFSLPIRFFEQRYTGDLVDRIDNDIEINDFLVSDLARTVVNFISACFFLVILISYSPVMTLIGLINISICLIVMLVCGHYMTNERIRQQISEANYLSTVDTGIEIIDTIQASSLETQYLNRIMDRRASVVALDQKFSRVQQIIGILPEALGNITDIIILLVGGHMVIEGNMSMGMLLGFNAMYDMMCQPVNELASFFSNLQHLKASLRRVNDIYRYPTEKKSSTGEKGNRLTGHVELENVVFGYSLNKSPTIKGISVSINAGESLAFVGFSGCGKSTIARLISGLYQPQSGTICFDGIPVEKLSSEQLQSSISIVGQNEAWFSGSIKDNLTMWNDSIPFPEIKKAAEDACISDFIENKTTAGYFTNLSEQATMISGGELQRLKIARALVTNPSILILDEATSALDPCIEEQVMNNIKRRGCTCIIVAHRLSTIRDCTRIAVIDNGQIVQIGKHSELLDEPKEGNLYHLLVQNK